MKHPKALENLTPFTPETQPSPEAKRKGWEKWRAEKQLTQAVIAEMTKGENLHSYVLKLIALAKRGNPKAIDAINRCLEEEKTNVSIDFENMTDQAVEQLFEKILTR